MNLKTGDTVCWTSQAQGHTRTKTGQVVEVVSAGRRPDRDRFSALYKGSGVGFPRDHESYVVHVRGRGHYWPRVSHLSLVAVADGNNK